MSLLTERLAFIRAGMETKRYHVVPTLGANTVAHHSCGVALLCMLLAPDDAGLLQAALLHDMAEHKAGDMPADVKRIAGVGKLLSDYETALLQQYELFNDLNDAQQRTLKFADCADGALFCCRERAMGNKLITPAYVNYMNYIGQLAPQPGPEVEIVVYISDEWSKANG